MPRTQILQIDQHVGRRIRERRVVLGMTQQQLADEIGVTYQQAHKYEKGINRVSAGRLFEIARVLSVPIGYFYEGLGVPQRETSPRERACLEIAKCLPTLTTLEQHSVATLVRNMLASREGAAA